MVKWTTEIPCDYWFAVVKQHGRAGTTLNEWQEGPKASYEKAGDDDSLGENSARLWFLTNLLEHKDKDPTESPNILCTHREWGPGYVSVHSASYS